MSTFLKLQREMVGSDQKATEGFTVCLGIKQKTLTRAYKLIHKRH